VRLPEGRATAAKSAHEAERSPTAQPCNLTLCWGVQVINKTCVKPCAKSCFSRLKSLAMLAVIADCTRNDHSTNSSKYFAYSRSYDFRLGAEFGWQKASFPQLDVSIPRPSRLSEGVLGKIPTGKEAQQDHTLKRSPHKGFPDGCSANRRP
jgi:hypothetical protein